MSFDEDEECIIQKLYKDFDLCIDTDLLGDYFMHDPLYVIMSPTFPKIDWVNEWLLRNHDYVGAMLS